MGKSVSGPYGIRKEDLPALSGASFLAPVLGGSQTGVLLEFPAEAGGIEISHRLTDCVNGLVGVQKQLYGSV